MCRLIAYKNKQIRNKGSYHVWSILQKFRGFKLICKYYFMHKVKKSEYYNKKRIKPLAELNHQLMMGSINNQMYWVKLTPNVLFYPASF